MYSISIPIPSLEADQVVEIEVTINGKARRFNYRVEMYDWENGRSVDERVDGLKQFIQEYDNAWQLVEIGSPSSTLVTLMFRQRL